MQDTGYRMQDAGYWMNASNFILSSIEQPVSRIVLISKHICWSWNTLVKGRSQIKSSVLWKERELGFLSVTVA